VCCGKKGDIEISRFRKRIKSEWGWWPFPSANLEQEYWECPECIALPDSDQILDHYSVERNKKLAKMIFEP